MICCDSSGLHNKKNTKSITICTVPIHVETHSFEDISKIKFCDDYGKPRFTIY